MRENGHSINDSDPRVRRFLLALNGGGGNTTPFNDKTLPNLTINAPGGVIAFNGGRATKHTHPIYWCILLISILFVFAFLLCVSIKINNNQAYEFSSMVKSVALCENKSPNQIHGELRKKYDYNTYRDMNLIEYHRAKWHLSSRTCD